MIRRARARLAPTALLCFALGLISGCAGTSVATGPAEAARKVPVPAPAPAETLKFNDFIAAFKTDAIKAGIRPDTYDRAVANIHLNPQVQTLNLRQPEFVQPVWEYLAGAASDARMNRGRDMLAANAALFDRLETAYGVPREVIAAIWGMETNYGQNKGSFNLFEALATLAYDGPRTAYGRQQFIGALKLAEAEKFDPADMQGSWAGAVGHTQFVPTTYLAKAVDGDGDGKRDLWNSAPDALASTANYLQDSGWTKGQSWGMEARVPDGFDYALADGDLTKTLDEWAKLGVKSATGGDIKGDMRAALFLPSGYRGAAFLTFPNFAALLKYNTATSYALGVGILSDRIAGRSGVIGSWPLDEATLSISQRARLQLGLTALGYDTGGTDGVIGRRSRAALRDYQKARGLPVDGYPTETILTSVINEQQAKANAP